MKKILLCCLSLCFISCEKIVEIQKEPTSVLSSQSYSICTAELSRAGISEARRDKSIESAACIVADCQPGYEKLNLKEYVETHNNSLMSDTAKMSVISIESVAAEYPIICMQKQKDCTTNSIIDGFNKFVYSAAPMIKPLLADGYSEAINYNDPMENFGYSGCQPKSADSCDQNFVYYEYKDQNNEVVYQYCADKKIDCKYQLADYTGVDVASIYFDANTNSYPSDSCLIESCQSGYTLSNNACVVSPPPTPPMNPCLFNPMLCMNPCMLNPALCVP